MQSTQQRERVVYLLGFCWFTCNRITEDMIFDENLHGIFHITTVDVHTLQSRRDARRRIHGSLKLQIVESINSTSTTATTTIKFKMNERNKQKKSPANNFKWHRFSRPTEFSTEINGILSPRLIDVFYFQNTAQVISQNLKSILIKSFCTARSLFISRASHTPNYMCSCEFFQIFFHVEFIQFSFGHSWMH